MTMRRAELLRTTKLLLLGVILAAVVAGSATTVARAQKQDAVASAEAIARLQKHLDAIEARAAAMQPLYDYSGPAEATLTAAFKKGGLSERVFKYADSWSGMALAFDFATGGYDIYGYHAKALSDSISHLSGGGTVSASRLDAIDAGMRNWTQNEENFQSLMRKRVELLVQSGKAIDAASAADAIECGNDDEACKQKKAAAVTAAAQESNRVDDALAANREEIAKATTHFFAALAGPLSNCTGVALSFAPATIRTSERARPISDYAPPDCERPKPDREPSYRIIASSGVEFLFDVADALFISENKAGQATVEVMRGPFKATANVTAVERPKCTDLLLRNRNIQQTIHLGEEGDLEYQAIPSDCDDRMAVFSSTSPQIVSVRRHVYRNGAAIFGRAVGAAEIGATLGGLRSTAWIRVVNGVEPCSELQLHYWVWTGLRLGGETKVDELTGQSPSLKYLPAHCRLPEGNPRFEEETDHLVMVDRDTGVLRARRVGDAKIVVKHEDQSMHSRRLRGITTVKIVPVPDCDRVELRYDKGALNADSFRFQLSIGAIASPLLRYTKVDGVNEPERCQAPAEGLAYSSDNAEVVSVTADGKITARTVGEATITVKVGNLRSATVSIMVVDQ